MCNKCPNKRIAIANNTDNGGVCIHEEACTETFKNGEWNMFNILTKQHFGKKVYWRNEDGTIYSKVSGARNITLNEAIVELLQKLKDQKDSGLLEHYYG